MFSLIELFYIIAVPALSVYILGVGSHFFIPLVIAIVIWYLVISIASSLNRISINNKKLYSGFSLILAIGICFFVFYLFVSILTNNITQIIQALPLYQERFIAIFNKSFSLLGIEKVPHIEEIFSQDAIVSFISDFAQTLTSLAGSMGIIFIYVLFLILERESFDAKLASMIRNPEKLANIQEIIKKISFQIQSYIRIKTLLSIFTTICSYIVMYFVGVDFAGFCALLIFFLNYIPTIGAIIGTILPSLLTILQFDSWSPFIIVTVTLTAIQFLIGNIIEPRFIGKTVNLSGLVIIISLAIWGKIWGITGMFLCVPIMVILNIVFTKFEKTRWIAVMLSSNGEIDHDLQS